MVRANIFFIMALALLAQNCRGQGEKKIVILAANDDRVELAKVLAFLQSSNAKRICLNVNLSECYQDSNDSQLAQVLNDFDSLITSSKLVPFGTGKYRDVALRCSYFYSNGQKDGFVNLVPNDSNQIEKFKASNVYKSTNFQTGEITQRIRYHVAVNIAFAIDPEKTSKFISSCPDTIKIDFGRKREFEIYSIDKLIKGELNSQILNDRVVIISTNSPSDYLSLPTYARNILEQKKMLTSEIFANIACQIIGE